RLDDLDSSFMGFVEHDLCHIYDLQDATSYAGHRQDSHAPEGLQLHEWAWPVVHFAVRQERPSCLVILQAYQSVVEARAQSMEHCIASQRVRSFHKWAQDSLVTGAAPLFGVTKLKGWAHSEAVSFGIRTSLPQAVADDQMR
ncbi:unnamed protein product, partial [Prorocentrum cordatum]